MIYSKEPISILKASDRLASKMILSPKRVRRILDYFKESEQEFAIEDIEKFIRTLHDMFCMFGKDVERGISSVVAELFSK